MSSQPKIVADSPSMPNPLEEFSRRELKEALAGRLVRDLGEAVRALRDTAQSIREFEEDARFLGNVSASLKSRTTELEAMAKSLEEEAEGIEKKMLGKGQEPIHTRVDADLAKKVAEAKEEE